MVAWWVRLTGLCGRGVLNSTLCGGARVLVSFYALWFLGGGKMGVCGVGLGEDEVDGVEVVVRGV